MEIWSWYNFYIMSDIVKALGSEPQRRVIFFQEVPRIQSWKHWRMLWAPHLPSASLDKEVFSQGGQKQGQLAENISADPE